MVNGGPLVGRDAELRLFSDWINKTVSGAGCAVLVEGEPGIGKSALIRTAMTAAERQGISVYWAECDEVGQMLALQPLLNAVQATQSGEPRVDMAQRLLRGEVIGVADPVLAAAEQLLALMTELGGAGPTVLVVDDMQWADPATISVWEWLARSASTMTLLVIGIARPIPQRDELLAVRRVVGPDMVLRAGGLSEEAVADLVTNIVHGVPTADLVGLASTAAGNPRYLIELIDALRDSNRLTVTDSGTVEVSAGPIPNSLISTIVGHLDFLPQDVRSVLRVTALFDPEFLVADLAIVLGRTVPELMPALDDARAAGVLQDRNDTLTFRHPLIRAALYEDVPRALRPAWHQDAATALAAAGAPIRRVAGQLLRAVDAPNPAPMNEALLSWIISAAPTLIAENPRVSIQLLRQASARTPATTTRGAILVRHLAEALYRTGEYTEAEHVAVRAMSVVRDPDLLVDLHWTLARCRATLGRSDEAFESLAGATALAGISVQQRARLLMMLAGVHRDLGEVTVAGSVAAKALATAEEAGDPWAVGWSLHMLMVVSMMRGDVPMALPLVDRALEVVGDDPELTDLQLVLQINKALALGDLDRYDEAVGAAVRVRQLADQTGSLVRLAQAQSALGELLFHMGRWDDAQAEVETLPDDFKEPATTCCDHGIAAVIAFHRGDIDTGRKHLRLAAPSAELIGNRVVSSLALARSLEHEVDDQPDKALAVLLDRAAGDAEELDEIEALLPEAARLAAQTGNAQAAAEIAEQAAILARRSQVPHRLAAAAYCQGLIEGEPLLLQHAADRYQDAGRRLPQAKALEAAAIRFAELGNRSAARIAFTDANAHYDQLGAEWDRARLSAQLRRWNIRLGSRAKRRRADTGWASLTPTETKVAELVAEGLNNPQIAKTLFLGRRTIESHVSSILRKLGIASRVDLIRDLSTPNHTTDHRGGLQATRTVPPRP